MRGRSSEMRLRVLAFSSPTCLFVALIVQVSAWRLVFTRKFGNEIERGPQTFEGDLDGKNPGGFPSFERGAEIIDQRLRDGCWSVRHGFARHREFNGRRQSGRRGCRAIASS